MTSQPMKDFPVAVGATLFEGERTLPFQHPALDGPLEKRESQWLHHEPDAPRGATKGPQGSRLAVLPANS
jgi:hypothetical protein